MVTLISESPDATASLGAQLARFLVPGDFLALTGDLGAGKTRFAQGIAEGLGVDPAIPVTSPTFTLINIYQGRIPLYHFDLYRLAGDEEGVELGFDEYFHGSGVSMVEWAERLSGELPRERLEVHFSHAGEERRQIDFTPIGERYETLLAQLFPGN